MAAFRQHLLFSTSIGVGYAVSLSSGGVDKTHAALSGALCAVAGMLPDLDSDSGKPVRELFGLVAAVVPLLVMRRLEHAGLSAEAVILVMGGLYLAIRFGVRQLFQRLTVHRGMFHSVPAALIAAEIAFLAHDCPEAGGRWLLGLGVLLGFLSHLVLDELSSVDASGVRIRFNKAAGSALKLASKSMSATLAAWLTLGLLTYLVCVSDGAMNPHAHSTHAPTSTPLEIGDLIKYHELRFGGPPRTRMSGPVSGFRASGLFRISSFGFVSDFELRISDLGNAGRALVHVRVKLMAHLRSKLPPGSTGGVAQLEAEPGTTVASLLAQLGLSLGHVHLIMVNGAQEPDRARPLRDGDELVIFPPVAGGRA